MLRLNLERLFQLHGVRHRQAYLINHGFTRDQARKLLDPKLSSLKFRTQTRLCKAFKCLPNDLYYYDGPDPGHLKVLNRKSVPKTDGMLEGLSPDDITELVKLAEQKRKGKD